tara:strand:+ start:28 stop:609 length:582 start_codon:yes stop_codon:yes gene_type:complete
MALAYSKVSLEIREISLRDRPEELYKASTKGTVPVLITSDDTVIDESLEIILWALKNNPTQTWVSDDSNLEIDLINENDTDFKKWLDKYKYHDRHPENPKEYYREQCQHILSQYEEKLNANTYLLRNEASIADIAIFPFVRQFAHVDYGWFSNNYNSLKNWLETIASSALFLSVMDKHETWKNEHEPKILSWE